MSEIVPFDFHNHQVRTIEREGQPWFVAADVLAVLGLNRSSLQTLDEDEKGVHTIDTPGGDQQISVINEPGFYSLVLRSRKAEAHEFKRWVTHEVLPAIRTTGRYEAETTRSSPRSQIDVLRTALDEIERVQQAADEARDTADEARETARESQARLDSLEGRRGWFSALAFCKLTGRQTDTKSLQRLGRMASTVGTRDGYVVATTDDARFGSVNTWPYSVWDEAAARVDAL